MTKMTSVAVDAHMVELNSYRTLIHEVDQELSTSEIRDLKFLCKDIIRHARLEECKRAIDIILELENRGEVSDGDTALVAELMFRIGRNDLVKKMGYGLVGFKKQLEQSGSRLEPFRVLLHELCEDLIKREVQELLFMAKDYLPAAKLEGITNAQGLFVSLEKAELLSMTDLSVLQELIKALKRDDLNERICRYQGISMPAKVRVLHQLPSYVNGSGSVSQPADVYYKMTARPRGFCIIINNHVFPKMHVQHAQRNGFKQFKDRRGSSIDAECLRRTFTNLQFEVVTFSNLVSTDIESIMARYALSESHDSYDCFACAILSHGGRGVVYGVDGMPVQIKLLTSKFKPVMCKSLKGKPKLFFIQACQGTDKDEALRIETDSPGDPVADYPGDPVAMSPGSQQVTTSDGGGSNGPSIPHNNAAVDIDANTYQPTIATIPNEADFLLGYSTVPGFVSFRDIDEGSWYISSLTKMLEQYAATEDLMGILLRVNEAVSKEIYEDYQRHQIHKQIPAPVFTLRKKVMFC